MMAIIHAKSVKMDCTITFDEREVELLGYLAGYGGKQIAEAVCKGISAKYKAEEWERLWTELRGALEAAQQRFIDTRNVFVGNKQAIWPRKD